MFDRNSHIVTIVHSHFFLPERELNFCKWKPLQSQFNRCHSHAKTYLSNVDARCLHVLMSSSSMPKSCLKNGKFNICKAAAGQKKQNRNFCTNTEKETKVALSFKQKAKRNVSQSSSSHLNTRSNKRIESQRKWNGKINSGFFVCVSVGNHCCYYYHFHKPSIEGIKIENTRYKHNSYSNESIQSYLPSQSVANDHSNQQLNRMRQKKHTRKILSR